MQENWSLEVPMPWAVWRMELRFWAIAHWVDPHPAPGSPRQRSHRISRGGWQWRDWIWRKDSLAHLRRTSGSIGFPIVTSAYLFLVVQWYIPSGKLLDNYGKLQCSMGKSTISMVIFNSYVKLPEGNWCVVSHQSAILNTGPWPSADFFSILWLPAA